MRAFLLYAFLISARDALLLTPKICPGSKHLCSFLFPQNSEDISAMYFAGRSKSKIYKVGVDSNSSSMTPFMRIKKTDGDPLCLFHTNQLPWQVSDAVSRAVELSDMQHLIVVPVRIKLALNRFSSFFIL